MTDAATPKRVIAYQKPNGEEPFSEWLDGLRDAMTKRRILLRIYRLEQGNFGDCKSVGDGVSELRLFFGAGYRVYFSERGNDLVIFFCGGDKSSQDSDIQQAKAHLKEYQSHAENENP